METTIYSRFKHFAETTPGHPAVTDERTRATYSEIDRMADTLISRFPSFIPARVGVVMDHSVEMIAAIMAILKAGAAFVPIEPDFPPERTARFLTETGVDFVVSQEPYTRNLKGFTLLIIRQEQSCCHTPHPLPDRSRADRPAYILHTTSPSGHPAGIMVGNRQTVDMAYRFASSFRITPDDVVLQYSACTVNTFIEDIFGTLLNGATLAIPSAATRNDPQTLMRFADEKYVSVISGFPYLLQELNRMKSLPITLRMLISGGDRLYPASVSRLLEQVTVYNTYGPAEATALTTLHCCNSGYSLPSGHYPIGTPARGIGLHILDSELKAVPDGTEGEICISGPCVADSFTGDHRDEMLATLATLPDGTHIARTGDIGMRLPDGNIRYIRRMADEVSILGRRVMTDEVQRTLTSTGQVRECAVVHYLDEKNSAYLVAYVVPSEPEAFSLSWIKNRLAQYLPAYMIPDFFVILRQLPVTASGRVNTLALPIVLKDSAAV